MGAVSLKVLRVFLLGYIHSHPWHNIIHGLQVGHALEDKAPAKATF